MPHQQVSQNAPRELQEELLRRGAALLGVSIRPSRVSVPGARAFLLDHRLQRSGATPDFLAGEFAHLHPPHDGSLHLGLAPEAARRVAEAGWAEPHPAATMAGMPGMVMVFGPRDAKELEIVWAILQAAYLHARGALAPKA
ncbi:MAG: luciferase family protein [Candidatus Thermoplasmatota archaeon]